MVLHNALTTQKTAFQEVIQRLERPRFHNVTEVVRAAN
jgi:hypothetical protein